MDETDGIECLFTDIELRGDAQDGLYLAQAAVKKPQSFACSTPHVIPSRTEWRHCLSRTPLFFLSRTRSTSSRPFLRSSSESSQVRSRQAPPLRKARPPNCERGGCVSGPVLHLHGQ